MDDPKDNEFAIEITEDGRIKIVTGPFSGAIHKTAEDFMAFVARQMGGAVATNRRPHAHGRIEHHDHVHAGGGRGHKH